MGNLYLIYITATILVLFVCFYLFVIPPFYETWRIGKSLETKCRLVVAWAEGGVGIVAKWGLGESGGWTIVRTSRLISVDVCTFCIGLKKPEQRPAEKHLTASSSRTPSLGSASTRKPALQGQANPVQIQTRSCRPGPVGDGETAWDTGPTLSVPWHLEEAAAPSARLHAAHLDPELLMLCP